ncbi:MAG: methyltransferase family protein [Candidatus Tyrphobacter sp.]
MTDPLSEELQAFIFANRGLLLAAPAALLGAFGKPSAFGVALGLPTAIAGELLRCWAVGYSGETTRGDRVTAPKLTTSGPYAYVRNPLYLGNFVTALGFTMAFTGKNSLPARCALAAGALGAMIGLYAVIVPHEERYLRERFGEEYDRYCARVPRVLPQLDPAPGGTQTWDASVIAKAESKTLVTFGAMLALLALKSIAA